MKPRGLDRTTLGARGLLAVALIAVATYPLVRNDPVLTTLYVLAGLWTLWAASLNIVWGLAGQFSMAQFGLGAISAYSYALLLEERHWAFLPSLLVALLGSVAMSAVIGICCVKLAGFRFAIVTLAFALGTIGLISNLEVTGRTSGISVPQAIPRVDVGSFHWNPNIDDGFYVLLLLLVVLVCVLTWWLPRTRTGRALLAIREDELLADSVGIRPARYRVIAFMISAVVAGLAGVAHAHYFSFISPSEFSFEPLVTVILILVLGGRGTWLGPVVGGGLYVALSNGWRVGGEYEGAVFGSIVIVLTIVAQRGLVGVIADLFRRVVIHRPLPAVPSTKLARESALDVPDVARSPYGEAVLVGRGLSRSFGGVTAVSGVSFTVGRHEIVGLIGPNGAGKTTLFNLISGFFRPDTGTVKLNGRSMAGLRPSRRVQAGMTRTFQHSRVFSEMSVRENLRAAAHVHRPGAVNDARERAERILSDFALQPYADVLAAQLSYGVTKRVSLAIAVATDAEILLLDEPAAGLTPGEIEVLRAELVRLRAAGRTILIVEHHMNLITTLCDRVLVLDAGKLIADKAPSELSDDPLVVAAYLGGVV